MPYQKQLEPKVKELVLPQGGQGWGGLNKYETFSRYTIPDTDFDDLVNAIPMGGSVRQVLGNDPPLATLVSTIIWMEMLQLNAGYFIFALCQNGHLYQVSLPGGVITDVSGATSLSAQTDITEWQNTIIIVSDPSVNITYQWNGTTFSQIAALNGIKGSYVTVYSGRLWMASGNLVVYTQGGTYNSLGGDSGSFLIIDGDCITPIANIYPFGGLLYIVGQDWAQVLGNLFVSGAPPVLQFQKYTIEQHCGTNSQFSFITFGSTLYFTNTNGVWTLTGTIPQKLSGPVDAFFDAEYGDSTFASAFAEIYSEPSIIWCLHTNIDGLYGALAYSISTQKWFRITLGGIKFVTDGVLSGQQTTFGTDGTNIFIMFANTAAQVQSTFKFKFWNFGTPVGYKRVLKMGVATLLTTSATATLNAYNESGSQLQAPLGAQAQTISALLIFIGQDGNPITWTN